MYIQICTLYIQMYSISGYVLYIWIYTSYIQMYIIHPDLCKLSVMWGEGDTPNHDVSDN